MFQCRRVLAALSVVPAISIVSAPAPEARASTASPAPASSRQVPIRKAHLRAIEPSMDGIGFSSIREGAEIENSLRDGEYVAVAPGGATFLPTRVVPQVEEIQPSKGYYPNEWRKCNFRSSKHQLVKQYNRRTMKGVPGRSANLRCGPKDNWGYWHIKAKHQADWYAKSLFVDAQWESFAGCEHEERPGAPVQGVLPKG